MPGPLLFNAQSSMNQPAHSAFLWSVADLLRGDYKQSDYGKVKLLESEVLVQQATNNTKEQFANSPDLANVLMNAILDAFAAHTTMSKQAIDSEKVRHGLKDILLGPAQLYEALRGKGTGGRPHA